MSALLTNRLILKISYAMKTMLAVNCHGVFGKW